MRDVEISAVATDLEDRCSCGHAIFVHGAKGCLALIPSGSVSLQERRGRMRPVQGSRPCPCARPGRETGW